MTKKIENYKVPCEMLGRILSVTKLKKKQIVSVENKLRDVVNTAKPGNRSVIQYVKTVIQYTLSIAEQAEIGKLLAAFNLETPADMLAVQNILASVYNSITEIYPTMRIEWICSDLNGFKENDLMLDPRVTLMDPELERLIEKETRKKSSTKKKEFEFTKLSHIDDLRSFLSKNIIGQEEAVKVVCDVIKLKAVGFTKTVNLFFVGKTGRGKTELARLLGQKYSGNFWLVNCAEFSNGHEVNRLLGAPPGYIGHSDKSLMKEKSEKSNKWVIVFDEIEKAHDKFFNFLLALMETGQCYDNIGTKIDFSDSIFIFTSNCGLKDLKKDYTGFSNMVNHKADKEELTKALEKQFSPEFRNRVDEFVYFNDLNREDAMKIAELRLRDYPVKKTKELVSYIVDNGFSDEFGAREVTRFIKKRLGLPLADTILDNKIPHDKSANYDVVVNNGKIEVINTIALGK
jgi:ATP-dependent Clp protease ATP-binding subunit ClpA